MKNFLFLLILAVSLLLVSCEGEGHKPYTYTVEILDKWEDNGAAFICFGSETKYHMTFRFYNNADSTIIWIYPGHEITNDRMYRRFEKGKTYTIVQDSREDAYFLCSNYDRNHHHDYYNPLKKGKGKRKGLKPEYEL